MMETKWTPGPWFAENDDGPVNEYGASDTGVWSEVRFQRAKAESDAMFDPDDEKWICGIWGELSAEDYANAYLIAAAPELYELVADAVEDVTQHETEWNKAARAALAKARGEKEECA